MIISPSYSSRKIYLSTKTYCRTPAMLGHCQVSVNFRVQSVLTVVFFRDGHRSRQCHRVALLLVLALSSLHRTSAWHLAGVGDEQQKVRRPVTDAGGGFAGSSGRHAPTTPPSAAQTTGARRVAFHSPECAAALVVNPRARSALSAAVEPVRSPHRGQTPLRQDQLHLAAKRVP